MKSLLNKITALVREEEGASAIEYGLLVALIALAIVVGAGALGTSINNLFATSATRLDAAVP